MENEYSKVYNYFFNKTFKNVETIFKTLLIKNKEQGRSFNAFHKKTTKKIYDLSTDKFYINTSNKFNDITKAYSNRNFLYEDKFTNSIFTNELYDIFYSIKKIKKGYTFKICMAELGQINGLYEAHRRLTNSEPLIQIIYKLNDFSEFKLWSHSTSVYGSKFYEKYRNKLYPPPKTEKQDTKKKLKNNFGLIKKYKKNLEDVFDFFILKAIIDTTTTYDTFKRVFTEDFNKHNDKITFNNTQEISIIFLKIQFAFNNLTDISIGKSKAFQSISGKTLSRDNLASSRKVFKDSDILALDRVKTQLSEKQIKALNHVKKIIEILKK